jgi:hypothetical protein
MVHRCVSAVIITTADPCNSRAGLEQKTLRQPNIMMASRVGKNNYYVYLIYIQFLVQYETVVYERQRLIHSVLRDCGRVGRESAILSRETSSRTRR